MRTDITLSDVSAISSALELEMENEYVKIKGAEDKLKHLVYICKTRKGGSTNRLYNSMELVQRDWAIDKMYEEFFGHFPKYKLSVKKLKG